MSVAKSIPEKNYPIFLPWIVFGTGVLYYCFTYLLRVYPTIIAPELINQFNVDDNNFAWIIDFFYIAYALMQLPVGVMIDKIGARRSLILGCLIASCGVLIFSTTHLYSLALVSRFMIGVGASFGYVTALKIASLWFPRRFFASATGILTGTGMVAAIAADNYLTHLLATTPFSHITFFPLYISLGLLLCILFCLKDKKEIDANQQPIPDLSYGYLFGQLWQIMKTPQMWLIGIVGTLMFLPSSIFVSDWAIPFLKTARHFSTDDAVLGALLTLAGWVISTFISGFISDRYKTRKIPLMIAALGAAIFSSLIIFLPNTSVFTLYIVLFLLGLCCGPHPLCFVLSKENCPHEISGTAVAFANFIIRLGGVLIKPVVGLILVHMSNSSEPNAVYSSFDFSVALSIIPIGLVIAYFAILFLQETYGNKN